MKIILINLLLVINFLNAKKIALLIGNSNYNGKYYLQNPINDVDLLEPKLKNIGFIVIKKKNLNYSNTIKILKEFSSKIDNKTIALIYFAGHGVHSTLDKKNYLIPINSFDKIINEADLPNHAISDGSFLASINGAKFSILLLDACRSNDFAKTRGGDRGLGIPSARLNNDYLISYATEVGKTASDGNSNNSPYAKALAKYLTSNYSIGDILTKVRAYVSKNTNGKQQPYYDPHFSSILYLNKDINKDKKCTKTITIPAKYEKKLIKSSFKYKIIPAKFKTKTYRIQISPSNWYKYKCVKDHKSKIFMPKLDVKTQRIIVRDSYEKYILSNNNRSFKKVKVPVKYKTITIKNIIENINKDDLPQDMKCFRIPLPKQYKEITKIEITKPSKIVKTPIPAKYKKVLVSKEHKKTISAPCQ